MILIHIEVNVVFLFVFYYTVIWVAGSLSISEPWLAESADAEPTDLEGCLRKIVSLARCDGLRL